MGTVQIPTPTETREHPTWCGGEHGELELHTAQVGADLELSEDLALAVYLSCDDGEPATVELVTHAAGESTFLRLSLLQAAILRDLLGEGLGVVAQQVGLR